MYARTCDGYDENGGAFSRLQFCVFSSTVIDDPELELLVGLDDRGAGRARSPRAPRAASGRARARTRSRRRRRAPAWRVSENSKAGTFCGMPPRSRVPLRGKRRCRARRARPCRLSSVTQIRRASSSGSAAVSVSSTSSPVPRNVPAADAVAVVAGEPQPVLVAVVEPVDHRASTSVPDASLRSVRGAAARLAGRAAARPSSPASRRRVAPRRPHRRSRARRRRPRRRRAAAAASARARALAPARDATRSTTCASSATGGGSGALHAPATAIRERQRPRDDRELAQLGPAGGAPVEVRAQRDRFGGIDPPRAAAPRAPRSRGTASVVIGPTQLFEREAHRLSA